MADTQPSSSTTSPANVRVESVQLSLLAPDPDQIRKHFDASALASLAESIKAQGLIQPIVVRPKIGNGTDYDYKIVAGERRYRAAQLAGIEHVPVIVRTDLANADIAVLQVLENLQRENLTLSETCAGVAKLVDTLGFAKTCQQLGKSEAWVSKHAGVLKLRPEIVALVGEGRIESVDIARELHALAELDDEQYQKLISRYTPQEDADESFQEAVHGETLPEPAATAGDEDERAHAAWQVRHSGPPTRAEIRAAIFDARADQLAETEAAQQQEKRSAMQAQAEGYAREVAEDDDDDAPPRDASPPRLPGESDHDRKYRERFHACKTYNDEAEAFAERHATLLRDRLSLPVVEGEPPVLGIRADSVPHWMPSAVVPSDTLTGTYHVSVDGPLDIAAPVLRALDITTEIVIEEDVTLEEAQAIQKALGRPIKAFRRHTVSGEHLAKSLVRASAKPKPAIATKTKAKGQGATAEQDDAPQGIAAFLKACVRKARVPGKRLAPADLHAAYVTWCKTQKRKAVPIKDKRWGQAVAAAGIEKVRSNGFWYVGIEVVKS